MDFNDLTDEQQAKARACKTTEELIELAQSEGVEVTDEQLEAVSGGRWYRGECTGKANECNDLCTTVWHA